MRIKYALEYDISPGFFPYGSESDDIIDFQDLSSFVSSFSKGSDAIDFSERFLLMSFLNNTFLDLPQYFLGLVPFIQSGLFSYETKFSCQKGRDVKKTTVANLYSLTRVSILNRSQSDAERRAKVDKALANELPRSFFSYKQNAELLNSLFVLQQDGCYSPLPW